MPMPHTIALHDDETAMSFASRLAFSNKLPSLVEFTADFGLTLSNLLNCDASAMATLAELGALDVTRLIERSFRSSGKSSFHILNHEIGKPHLDIGSNRMCPACFRADIGDPMTEASVANAYGRILWDFASVRTCPVHRLLLIVPPESIKNDFLPSWTPWLPEVVDGDLDQPVKGGGLLEHHIAARLRGDAPEGWATRFPVDILGSACEVLGALELFGKEVVLVDLTDIDLAGSTSTGFERLNAGPPALLLLFETIRNMPAAPQDKLQARYGPLYRWFTSGVGKDAAFAPLRDVFRKHVFATWPLAEGDSVLNYRLPKRRLHSIRTASIAHGLHAKRLRRLLVDAEIIPETDRPDFDVIFDALKA